MESKDVTGDLEKGIMRAELSREAGIAFAFSLPRIAFLLFRS
jgi:hypothetical protein